MIIAITAKGSVPSCNIDPLFGRAQNFLLFNTEAQDWKCISNTQNLAAAQGAGIQAAQQILEAGATIVISGNVGPKAMRVLSTAGIKSFAATNGTVQEALDAYMNNELAPIL